MRVFIIGGRANVGKNVLAKYIKEYYDKKGEKSIITEYSKYIKLLANEMINWEERNKKPRKLLQDLGEEYRKITNTNVFIDRMKEDILVLQKYYKNIIICDARLIPEFTLMKTKYKNCYTIHLIGDKDKNLSEYETNHITETELDNYKDFDYEIVNNDFNKLKEDIYKILDTID